MLAKETNLLGSENHIGKTWSQDFTNRQILFKGIQKQHSRPPLGRGQSTIIFKQIMLVTLNGAIYNHWTMKKAFVGKADYLQNNIITHFFKSIQKRTEFPESGRKQSSICKSTTIIYVLGFLLFREPHYVLILYSTSTVGNSICTIIFMYNHKHYTDNRIIEKI